MSSSLGGQAEPAERPEPAAPLLTEATDCRPPPSSLDGPSIAGARPSTSLARSRSPAVAQRMFMASGSCRHDDRRKAPPSLTAPSDLAPDIRHASATASRLAKIEARWIGAHLQAPAA
jgi:hypothetical protein